VLLLTAPAGADAPRPLRIRADPPPVVDAAPLLDDVTASVTIAGRSEPRTSVTLTVPCALGPCVEQTVADRKGRWSTRLDLVVRRETGSVVVTAAAMPGLAAGPVRLRIAIPVVPPLVPDGAPHLAVFGDSLAEGMAPYLAGSAPELRVSVQGRRSRFLAEGMQLFDVTPLPEGRRVIAFSLFTNDHPAGLPALEQAVRASVERVGTDGCAVWATIARPAQGKASYARVNARLEELAREPGLAGHLRVVPWAREARRRKWLAKDRVHATAAGYRGRAALYIAAARDCLAAVR
jgi:hypothetical protein